jgi:hypothetical protein
LTCYPGYDRLSSKKEIEKLNKRRILMAKSMDTKKETKKKATKTAKEKKKAKQEKKKGK